jgi:hypothetical protein
VTPDQLKALVPGDTLSHGGVFEVLSNDGEGILEVVPVSLLGSFKLDYSALGKANKIRSAPTTAGGVPSVDGIRITNADNSAFYVDITVDATNNILAQRPDGKTQPLTIANQWK